MSSSEVSQATEREFDVVSCELAQKVSAQMSSLCDLCVLCYSVVVFSASSFTTKDTEDTEVAQRKSLFSYFLCKAFRVPFWIVLL